MEMCRFQNCMKGISLKVDVKGKCVEKIYCKILTFPVMVCFEGILNFKANILILILDSVNFSTMRVKKKKFAFSHP